MPNGVGVHRQVVGVMRFALFLRYPSGCVYGDREECLNSADFRHSPMCRPKRKGQSAVEAAALARSTTHASATLCSGTPLAQPYGPSAATM
jgi:hypothetical protein